MPALIKRLSPAGLEDAGYAADNLRDAARHEPKAGVYTVGNTFHSTQTLLLSAHLDRLEDSARREGMALSLDRPRLRAALRAMIIESGFGDVRFRITAPAATPNTLIISLEPYAPPRPELLRDGVSCLCDSAIARRNPAAKCSEWMSQREALLADTPAHIYEILLVDGQGGILEGATSNFYAIIGERLLTAREGALAGISRRIVMQTCAGIVKPLAQAPKLADLPRFDEAFLTSSSRGIIPVIAIDGMAIGSGKPGPRTLQLRQAYDCWVASHLEEL